MLVSLLPTGTSCRYSIAFLHLTEKTKSKLRVMLRVSYPIIIEIVKYSLVTFASEYSSARLAAAESHLRAMTRPSRLKQIRLRLTEAELSPLHTNVHFTSSFHVKSILLFLLPLCIEDSLYRSSVGIGELSVFLSRDASSLVLLILELHLLSTVYRRSLRVSFELTDQYF